MQLIAVNNRDAHTLSLLSASRKKGYAHYMKRLTVDTKSHRRVVDITELLAQEVRNAPDDSGLCHVFVLHTTACLTTADLDPGTDLDMLDAFVEMVPKLRYRHPHNPAHVGDHIISSMIGPSVLVPYKNRELQLGTWQRIVLIEMDGPRTRELLVSFLPQQHAARS
jgi:secondary thiamine-phosphate synthase enzyme